MTRQVLFGRGVASSLPAALLEAGAERVLVLAKEPHTGDAQHLAAALGPRCVGVFTDVQPQVPRAVADAATAAARTHRADWLVACGGGSTVGVAKAVALSLDVKLAALPTTYAGSECTNIWGITTNGQKTTGRDDRVRPRLVAYDPDLTMGLPRELSLLSLLNALAHAVEALYAAEATAAARTAARESLAPILAGLRGLGADLQDPVSRVAALRGAWRAAEALDGSSMALHHKLAHVLGGSFGTAHAPTHGTLLPYTMAFNLPCAPTALAVLQEAWGVPDPAACLYDLMRTLGLSVRLKDLGLTEADLSAVAQQAAARQYPNPREVDATGLHDLLLDAWHGRRPTQGHGRLALGVRGAHGGLCAATAGVSLETAPAVVLAVHGRGADADRFVAQLRELAGPRADAVAWLGVQARDGSWYPQGFLAPLEDNQPHFDGALAALDAAWAAARAVVPADRIVLAGFSQGACLLLSWLTARDHRPGSVLAFSGAPTPLPGTLHQLAGARVFLGVAEADPWIPHAAWRAGVAALEEAGAQVEAVCTPTAEHRVHAAGAAALRSTLEAVLRPTSPFSTQTGFGNHLRSEAVEGALPLHQNAPQRTPHGLVAEQLNGTGFTVERARNRRTWLYRLRPAVHARPWTPMAAPPPFFVSSFSEGHASPEVLRFRPLPIPAEGTDFVDGMQTFAGAGDPALRRGLAIHVYAARADMDRVFCNVDGDLLVVPQQGRLRVQTELGWLEAQPGALLLLPRGMRFRVELPDGSARGFVAELFEGHFELPNRGVVGANGLADERHFHAPVAAYEDRPEDTRIVAKQNGRFWETLAPNSPFDVVAWHGTYAPFVYALEHFNALGAVSFDHPDPSLLTVLTAPLDTHGRSALDVAAFTGRWDASEHTFRPPFFHRNAAVEFNAVVSSPTDIGPYRPGTFTYTPTLSPHGVSAQTQRSELARSGEQPHRISDQSVWVQFESAYQLRVLPRWQEHPSRDAAFLQAFAGWELGALASAGPGPSSS